MRALGAIVAKSCHVRHVFLRYENQANIARKWSLAKEYEKNQSYGHTCVHDNMVAWAIRALGSKGFERDACVTGIYALIERFMVDLG